MKRSIVFRLIAMLMLLGVMASMSTPLFAGGWAVVTLDALPTRLVAGEAFAVGLVVRQHGRTPMKDLTPTLIAQHIETGERVTAVALPEGEVGHYVAALTLPSAGVWHWVINDGFVTTDAFGLPSGQPMPDLTVLGETSSARPASTSFNLMGMMSIVSLIGAAGGLLMLIRTRRPWAAGLLLASAVVAGLSFAPSGQAAPNVSMPGTSLDSSPEEMGRALFLAKGCVMCHAHAEFTEVRKAFGDFIIGPDLSTVPNTAEYLHTWLKDPQAIKPTTEMPNLNLSEAEIDALVAFLKADG